MILKFFNTIVMKRTEISRRENQKFFQVPFIICLLFLSANFYESDCQTNQGVYKIQVASSVTQIPLQQLQKELKLTEAVSEHVINGRFKYFVGKFSTFKEGQDYLVKVPVKGAYVVRIDIETATSTDLIPKDKPKEIPKDKALNLQKELPKVATKEVAKEIAKELPNEKPKVIPAAKIITATGGESKKIAPVVKKIQAEPQITELKFQPGGTLSYHGKEYAYTTIGNQSWIIENLAFLPSVSPSSTSSFTEVLYYVYGYDGSKVQEAQSTSEYNTFGVLYNWEAAKSACPPGWHLPTYDEWATLAYNLGTNAGGKMKESGSVHWPNPNSGATNESQFAALPGGFFQGFGAGFFFKGECAHFWTASFDNIETAGGISIYKDASRLWRDNPPVSKANGLSVRCVRD